MQTTAGTTLPHQNDAIMTGKQPWLRLLPEDGWLTLVLLIIVVYTTIASIQSVTPSWAPGLSILTTTTGMGLLLGYLAVQQARLPSSLVHTVAIILGVLFAFQQTAGAVLSGSRGELLHNTQVWFQSAVIAHNTSNDNTVFLLFLAILSFLLAYISVWLVLHTRRPWLAALANGVVLLINLNWATDDKSIFFIILFLLATLLLLVRFTLAENVRQWRLRGLRFSPDLGWDFLQAGALFAVIVLTLANILPAGGANASILSAWNSRQNPWQSFQTTFQTLFNGVQGGNGKQGGGGGFSFFNSSLTLSSNPHLPNVPVLHYTLTDASGDPSQYLITQTLDSYDGSGTWTASNAQLVQNTPNEVQALIPDSPNFKVNTYQITLNQTLGGNPLFAPGSSADSFNVSSQTYINDTTLIPVRWLTLGEARAGMKYNASAYVSTATVAQLQAVPSPQQDKAQYSPALLSAYLPPDGFPTSVIQAAKQATSGALNMYDAAADIEAYLHSPSFRYSLNVPPPPSGIDPVTWFLQNKVGFCTYFASAMVLMARYLGMPARIALGFSHGSFDQKTGTWVVLGTEAHAWPQIYFANYGWINFEPTTSFDGFSRTTNTGATQTPTNSTGTGNPTPKPKIGLPNQHAAGGGSTPGSNKTPASAILVDAGLGLTLLIMLALLAGVLFASWWRLLYRRLSPIAGAFARIVHLGAWAGAPPRRSQTPNEYIEQLGTLIPGQRAALHRLGHLYARERWGGGLADETTAEVTQLYGEVRTSIIHQFGERLRALPVTMFTVGRRLLLGKESYNGARTPLRSR